MHRVELKDFFHINIKIVLYHVRFLMHRVELKVKKSFDYLFLFRWVPNAPCGVESLRR